MQAIKDSHPDLTLLVTTGTVTSARIAAEELSGIATHQYIPLDGPRMVERFLTHWKPNAAFFVESEIWPNLIYKTSDQGIPLILLNARMSMKSSRAWRRVGRKRTAASLFTRFDLILTQTPVDLLHFTRLCASNVEHVGNLKLDAPAIEFDQSALGELRKAIGPRTVFVAASTHPGEDEQIAEANTIVRRSHPDLLTIIVPRHPERGARIAELLNDNGRKTSQRSLSEEITKDVEFYVADTIGELGLFYSLSDATFVGGSLVPHGGQNPVEPLRLGNPVLLGPHTKNFQDINATLDQHAAIIRVTDAEELAKQIEQILAHPGQTEERNARAVVALSELEGALEKTMERIEPYLSGAVPDDV